ncbi:MAG TPA: hypothetical protein PK079_20260 [Leptospiraceae bacterium]|nr:hypothetical protein [Leptospiraceae bacterium]HMW07935.1 hypothetical protein [Leptospiraceae bacterium]HMX35029.1 hypothetical protein [Leptospiraceae bacterium]HMY34246.1 hypothetical protein [Leptospiraceae bacterium]HMZ64714.1 hypothetical protein [Leptospiraceae bacterium]
MKQSILFLLILSLFFSVQADPYEDYENEDDKTVTADPDREKMISDAKVKLEISKLTHTALGHIKAKEWKNAEAVTKQIFELSEVSVDYFYLKGNLSYCYGEYYAAIGFLNTALKYNPNHEPSHFLMGMIHSKRNEWDKAIYSFDKAAQYGSYNPYYRMNLAISYFQVDNFDKAAAEARKTLELKENYLFAKILLIKSLMKVNKKEAWFYTQGLMEKNSDKPNVYSLYIQLLFEYKNNYPEIIKELGKKNNLSLNEKRYLAHSYFRENDLNRSLNLFKQIIASERETEDDQVIYMKILLQQGKDAEAERYLISMIRSNPSRKKHFTDIYQGLLDKRDMVKGMYLPIIVR